MRESGKERETGRKVSRSVLLVGNMNTNNVARWLLKIMTTQFPHDHQITNIITITKNLPKLPNSLSMDTAKPKPKKLRIQVNYLNRLEQYLSSILVVFELYLSIF